MALTWDLPRMPNAAVYAILSRLPGSSPCPIEGTVSKHQSRIDWPHVNSHNSSKIELTPGWDRGR